MVIYLDLTRKCALCGEKFNALDGVRRNGFWYHEKCYIEKLTKRSRPKVSMENALLNFDEDKEETMKALVLIVEENNLLSYLAEYYDIPVFSNRFMVKIKNLKENKGGSVFKDVSFAILLDIFKNQKFQSSIRNMPIGKNLICEDKLNYDLAVALKKYGSYVKFQKSKDEKYACNKSAKEAVEYLKNTKINNKSHRSQNSTKRPKRDDDILF